MLLCETSVELCVFRQRTAEATQRATEIKKKIKNMRKMNFTTLLLMLLTGATVNAQEVQMQRAEKHEYSLYATRGMSFLMYDLYSSGISNDSYSTMVGAGYTFNFNSFLALSTGVEYSNWKGEASYKSLNDHYFVTDHRIDPSTRIKYEYRVDNYHEKQTLDLLSIPVMLRLKTALDRNTSLYFAGGFKVGIPISTKADISGKLVSSSGHYEYEDIQYINLPKHNFFVGRDIQSHTSKIETHIAAMLSLETGMRFSIKRALIYTGLYFDWSLNDLKKSNDKYPLQFNESSVGSESLLNSPHANKLKIMSGGIKIGIGLF